jgi:Serpin (serine protease inhibitor)
MGLTRLFSTDSDFSKLFEENESSQNLQQKALPKAPRSGRRSSLVEFFTGTDKKLSIFPAKCICRVMHKAVIEVNEEGATVAAPKGALNVILQSEICHYSNFFQGGFGFTLRLHRQSFSKQTIHS